MADTTGTMRVLHVTDTFLPKIGGAEIAIDQLVRAMGKMGHECSVLAQRRRGVGKEIDTPYRLRRFANPRSSLWAGWWIERRMRALGPADIVIGHHAFPPGYACVKFGQKVAVPSIVYPRGGDIYEVSRFRRKKLAWKKLTSALVEASAVVCASEAMEGIVRQITGGRERRIVRIPNGVNVAELRQEAAASRFARDPKFKSPFVLGLGRAIHRKGFHLLIEAFAALTPRDWRLVIAGDGRELEALRRQAASQGERVVFTGLVEGADKRWLLQHCRFMAAPSLEESFGNVALEAMSCGKPVIASRASGFAEIVRHGENGLLVEVGDAGSLREAVETYRRSSLERESAAALATAEAFSWETIAARWDVLMKELTART